MATSEDRVDQSTDEKIDNRSASEKEEEKTSDQDGRLPDHRILAVHNIVGRGY